MNEKVTKKERWPGSSVTRTVELAPLPQPDRAPEGVSAARAKKGRTKPVPVCSYCGCSGGKGTATVCGASIACPVCSAPEWPALVEAYGAHNA